MASKALSAAGDYLRRNPGEITRAIRNLLGLRAGLPIDALRWLLELGAKSGKLEDPVLTEVPPGIRFTATIDAMGTPVRASAVIYIDRLVIDPEQIRCGVGAEIFLGGGGGRGSQAGDGTGAAGGGGSGGNLLGAHPTMLVAV